MSDEFGPYDLMAARIDESSRIGYNLKVVMINIKKEITKYFTYLIYVLLMSSILVGGLLITNKVQFNWLMVIIPVSSVVIYLAISFIYAYIKMISIKNWSKLSEENILER
jgi:hypothetical protein